MWCLLFEVTGAFCPESVKYLKRIAAKHDNALPYALDGPSWSISTFSAYFTQWISMAIQRSSAREILRGIRQGALAPKRAAKSHNHPGNVAPTFDGSCLFL